MRTTILAGVLAALLSGGCTFTSVEPMLDAAPSSGLLLRTHTVPLSSRLQLRRYELLHSDVSNDAFPFNLVRAAVSDPLVSKLFLWSDHAWQMVDFVEMPRASALHCPYLSRDGRRIVYERPNVPQGEKQIARAYPRQRDTYQVVLYDTGLQRRLLLEGCAEVYAAGQASHWRSDGGLVAFTTTCVKKKPFVRGLAVFDATGASVLDPTETPELVGLEFIAIHAKDGRIAALRPAEAGAGGRGGGAIVEVDPETKLVRDVAEVNAATASKNIFHLERLVRWDAKGQLVVRK